MSEAELERVPEPDAPKAESPKIDGVLKGDVGTERAMVVMCVLLVGLAGLLVFVGGLGTPLSGRDLDLFGTSTLLHRLVTAPQAFAQLPEGPLTALGYALNWSLLGTPLALHVGNLILHMLAAMLVYLCGRSRAKAGTPEPVAMTGGLVVAVALLSPATVYAIAGRPAIQGTVFGLSALWVILSARKDAPVRPGVLVLALGLYGAAVASHAALLVLPIFALVLDIAGARRHAAAHAALWALGALLGVALWSAGYRGEGISEGSSYLLLAAVAVVIPALISRVPGNAPRAGAATAVALVAVFGAYVAFREQGAWLNPMPRLQAEAERAQTAEAWRQVAEFGLAQPEGDAAVQTGTIAALEQWRAKDPESARAAALHGRALMAAGKQDEALPVLLEALRRNPWDGAATAAVAGILEQRARTGGRDTLLLARDYYQRAHDLGALGKEQLEPYAMVLAGLGDLKDAAAVLKQVVGDSKEGPAAAMLQRLRAGQQQIAEREKKSAELLAQKDNGGTQAVVLRAETEYLKGRYMQSFYLLDRVLRKEPENAQAWSLLGLTRARMQSAEAFVTEYAALPAASPQGWEDLLKRCAASNLWEAAEAYIGHAPGENPELRLATMAQEYRQPQRVEQYLKKAAEKAPADPLPWLRIADFNLQRKDIPAANTALAEAQKRGASEEQLKPLRDQLGAPATPGGVVMQKIVN